MLHPGAQRSEHRKTWLRASENPVHAAMDAQRQSGLQRALGPGTTRVSPSHWRIFIISAGSPAVQTTLTRCPFFGGKIILPKATSKNIPAGTLAE